MRLTLKPVFSERSVVQAKEGKYTFVTSPSLSKPEIAKIVERVYGVSVVGIRTTKKLVLAKKARAASGRRNAGSGRIIKKALVSVKKGDKISVFEEWGEK